MRHHDNIRKFGRERKVRKALIKSLASSLISKGKIKTTDAKAKEIRPYVEKLVTLAKKGTLASRRIASVRISEEAVGVLFKDVVAKHKSRSGGYTRVVKLGQRKSDGASMSIIEFV